VKHLIKESNHIQKVFFLSALALAIGTTLVLITAAWPQDQGSEMDQVYSVVDQRNLTIAEKYAEKMKVFNASLEAGNTYTSAFEDLALYARIAQEAGGILQPGFGNKLEEFQSRLSQAMDNKAFKAYSGVVKAKELVDEAVKLVSEINEISKDTNLPGSAKRSPGALRLLGAVRRLF
jgi:hypothetical protein